MEALDFWVTPASGHKNDKGYCLLKIVTVPDSHQRDRCCYGVMSVISYGLAQHGDKLR